MEIIKIIEEKAKKKILKVVICEGWDERCLKAADDILKKKLAKIVLLGDPKQIKQKAKEFGVDISKAEIVDYKKSKLKKELAEKLVEARKHKGMTLEQAKMLIENENYFGCMYALLGYADAVAGSAICPTAELMRPTLQLLRKPDKLVSEVGLLEHDGKLFFESDASLNIEPNAEELAQIALNAAETARSFGITPKVAMLSFSTKGSGGDVPQLKVIKDALELVKKKDPKLLIDGEMQVDAAVNPKAAARKCPDSTLKGEANVLIFPNLTASNICVHALAQFAKMELSFTVLKGLRKPVAILGRSTPLETVRNMIVGLAIQA